jgi:anti-sigma factor RsiW
MSDLATQRLLERYLAGELGKDGEASLEARLVAEPALAERLAALKADDAGTLAALPPEAAAREIARRQHLQQVAAAASKARRPTSLNVLWWLVPAPLALAALLVLRPAPGPVTDGAAPAQGELEATRTKGLEPHLRIYLGGGAEPVVLRDGAQVKPHDVVQVAVVAPGRLWAAVVSIDAQGGATLHAAPSAVGLGEVRLPRAFELDASPGFERFFLVVSGAPFEAQPVLAAARALARDPSAARSQPLSLPASLSQSSLLLDKVQP